MLITRLHRQRENMVDIERSRDAEIGDEEKDKLRHDADKLQVKSGNKFCRSVLECHEKTGKKAENHGADYGKKGYFHGRP